MAQTKMMMKGFISGFRLSVYFSIPTFPLSLSKYWNLLLSLFPLFPFPICACVKLHTLTSFYILVIEMTHTPSHTHTNANTKPFRNALSMQLFSMFPYIRFWNGILVLVHCTGSHILTLTLTHTSKQIHIPFLLFTLPSHHLSHFIQLNLRRE